MISFKRSRSSWVGSFDLNCLVKASHQPVRDSVAFPSIEWSNDIEESEDDAELIAPPVAKRRCRGLVRSDNIKYSLSTLGSSSPRKEWTIFQLSVPIHRRIKTPWMLLFNAKDDTPLALAIRLFYYLEQCMDFTSRPSQHATFSRHILSKTVAACT
jgi:hypothetical protein